MQVVRNGPKPVRSDKQKDYYTTVQSLSKTRIKRSYLSSIIGRLFNLICSATAETFCSMIPDLSQTIALATVVKLTNHSAENPFSFSRAPAFRDS